jgi:hypothetical protein
VSIQNLPYEEQQRVNWVLDWISRMTDKFGGTCREKETSETVGKSWDWGQALCRLCYGEDWNNYISEQNIETPSWEDIEKAKEWEAGKNPEWWDRGEE